MTGDGIVSVIRDSDTFQLVAKNDLQESIFATPAIVDSSLYVRTAKYLYAFKQAKKK